MFREITRFKQALPREECIEILKQEKRGVLSVLGDDDYPYGMPLNHFYNEADGKLYFHSGMKGHRTDAMLRHPKASFCVCDEGFVREGEWARNIRSVIVFGKIEVMEDADKALEIIRALSHKFTDDESYIAREIKSAGPRTLMFSLSVEHMTGKLVNEA